MSKINQTKHRLRSDPDGMLAWMDGGYLPQVSYESAEITGIQLSLMLEGHEDVLVVIANRNPHPITYTLPEGLDDLIPIINTMGVEGRDIKVDSFTCALLGRGMWAG